MFLMCLKCARFCVCVIDNEEKTYRRITVVVCVDDRANIHFSFKYVVLGTPISYLNYIW